MARLLHGHTRHWRQGDLGARSPSKRGVLRVWPAGVVVVAGWLELVGREKASEAICEEESCQAASAWNASCIFLACPHSSALALTSSLTTVGGVCTYVQVSVACSEPSMAAALPQLS